jgi:hypothetical protein
MNSFISSAWSAKTGKREKKNAIRNVSPSDQMRTDLSRARNSCLKMFALRVAAYS